MRDEGKHIYEFGPFRIDRSERLLRRGAEVIPLQPKALDTLLVLVENGDRAVDRDELLTLVWPDVMVERNSVDRNVSLLRKALGESPRNLYIETIAKHGYRFTAPVKVFREDLASARSLAVLPLENLSRDPAEDFFADGMTDELISYLMKIEVLRVSSRLSVMAYKGVGKPLRQVAQELKADWIVEGTVLRADDRVRIAVCLIDGPTERQVWAEKYEREMRDVLALQSEVASAIVREIEVKVTPPDKARLARSRPVNPEAYDAYLRGRYFWNKRTREEIKRAIRYFRQAIDQDPTYAPAHAGLADAYALLGSIGYEAMPPREAMPLAKAAAKNALQFDDTLAEAHTSLAKVMLNYDWDWAGAEREFKRSIELNPNYAIGHEWYGHLLIATGRLDEAISEMRRALALDPLSIPCNLAVGYSLYCARNFDEAIEQYRKTLEIAPTLPLAFCELSMAYASKGLYQKSLTEAEKACQASGGEAIAVTLLARAHARLGRKTEARRELARLQEMSKQKYVPAFYFACIHAGLDDKDRAFEWFQKAYEERSNYLIYLAVDASADNLRGDSRYLDLLGKVGLADPQNA